MRSPEIRALVTPALIAANISVFALELSQPSVGALRSFVQRWGLLPSESMAGQGVSEPHWITLFTSMFLHAGWAHLGGNMLYLWIFGDNIERRLGHARFFAFYVMCGVAAGLIHVAANPTSQVPTVGASGAISGILGGYLVLFPMNGVRVFRGHGAATVPALLMLGTWVLIQVVNSLGVMVNMPETGGVAYLAHIGGFAAGVVLISLLGAGDRPWAIA